ncbi:TPA: hypothetical protein ACH3X2_001573 [Trebouxia sp. C0005]
MRGFEQCSTSYAIPSAVMCEQTKPSCRLSRPLKHSARRRILRVCAEAKDTQLAQQTPGGQLARSESFMQQEVTLQEAHDGSWVDKVDDWGSFWGEDEYLMFDDEQLDDSYDGLTMGSKKNTELIKKAHNAITQDLLSVKWREEHPEVVHWLPYPLRKEYDPEIPEPEPLPERDWTEFELRAWVQKRRWKAGKDAEWHQRQEDVGRFDVVNVTEENDTRLMPRHELSKTWTHEEIWDLILNGGMNANPADVPMRTFDPGARTDFFTEGIKYFPEMDEWLADIGHLWEDEAEPDVGQEVSMLASDFSDINVGNSADDTDDPSGEADNEDESATAPDDEASELGNLFGQTDL